MRQILSGRTTRLVAGGSLILGPAAMAALRVTPAADAIPLPEMFTFTVDTLADPAIIDPLTCDPTAPVAGSCSLRNALGAAYLAATNYGSPSTIVFDPTLSGTIALTANLPYLFGSTTITGPGSDVLTIEGGGTFGGFVQEPIPGPDPQTFESIDLEISGLTLSGLSAENGPGPAGSVTPTAFPATFRATAVNLVAGNLDLHDAVVTGSGSRATSAFLFGFGPISVGSFAYLYGWSPEGNTVVLDNVDVAYNVSELAPSEGYATTGSMLAFASDVSITNSSFRHNSATVGGGPLLFGDSVHLADVDITDNSAASNVGGLGVIAQSTIIERTVISGNTAMINSGAIAYGGFLADNADSRVELRDSIIVGNISTYGDVITVASGTSLLQRTSIVGNTIVNPTPDPQAPFTVADAVYPAATVALYSDTVIESSTIAANAGAAIAIGFPRVNNTSTPSTMGRGRSVISALLGHRTASDDPIAPAVDTRRLALHLAHSTVAHNTAGGIVPFSTGVLTVPSATVWLDHSLLAGNGSDDLAVPSTAWFSLIQRASVIPTDAPADHNKVGVDPEFSTLGLPFSCPSRLVCVVPIEIGTPAWNAGDPLFTPPPSTDQRGEPRVVEIIDMGAYEVQTLVPKFTG